MDIDSLVNTIISGQVVNYATDADEKRVGLLMFSLMKLGSNLVINKNSYTVGPKLITNIRMQYVENLPGMEEALRAAFTRFETSADQKPNAKSP